MVDRNDSLMRELDSEMRNESYQKIWDKYKVLIIAAILAIPLGTLGWQVYDGQRRASAEAAGAKFEAARRLLVEKKEVEADTAFANLAASGPSGYATLARLHAAASLVKADKKAEAVAAYDALFSDATVPAIIGDLAGLQAAGLRLDAADWTEMQNRLTPLMDEKVAYRAMAREMLGLAALKAGKIDDARAAFLLILGDVKASQQLRERVQSHMAGIAASDLAKQPPGAAPAGSDPAQGSPAQSTTPATPAGDATKK